MRIFLVLALLVLPVVSLAQETVTDCKYTDATRRVVQCLVGGKATSIPTQAGNRHWNRLVRERISVANPD